MERLLERVGRATATHPWRTVAAWLLTVVGLLLVGQASGGGFSNEFRIPGIESQRAVDLTTAHFPEYGAVSADVVWRAEHGRLDDPERRAAVARVVDEFRSQPDVVSAGNPLTSAGDDDINGGDRNDADGDGGDRDGADGDTGGALSPDGRSAVSTVQYGKDLADLTAQAAHRLDAAAETAREAGVAVEFRGMVIELASQPETGPAELIGVAAALLVLLIAFGSAVAAGLPVLVALVGLLAGTPLVVLAATQLDVPAAAPIVAVMLGLGAGIDYALFVVTRFRRHLAEGLAPVDAAGRATATAGHAVLFAGATVVVAILGLAMVGIPFIAGMGAAAALTVAATMVAALTLLPAVLGLLGPRVNRWRIGRRRPPSDASQGHPTGSAADRTHPTGSAADRTHPTGSAADRTQPTGSAADGGQAGAPVAVGGRWDRWSRHVDRYRVAYTVGAAALLLAIAAPVLSLRLGVPDDGNQPEHWTQRKAYDTVAENFGPGWNAPLLIAVEIPTGAPSGTGTDPVGGALAQFAGRLADDPEVAIASPATRSRDGRLALVTVVPRHGPQDAEVRDLVHRVRDSHARRAFADTGLRARVGGTAAMMIDLTDTMSVRLPIMMIAVLTAGGLILLAMFRAPLTALKAVVAALLSIGAAHGVLVAVFQWGWGLSLLGLDDTVPIMPMIPMLLFAVLFGLSMDYEVFLLSAVREEYVTSGDPRRAVVGGLAGTGRVITAAAAIMAIVFLAFTGISDPLVKMLGVGLASAVVVDATVIRVVLGPAVMSVLGRLAWWPIRPSRSVGTPHTEGTAQSADARRGRPVGAART